MDEKIYIVYREYCTPREVIIFAKSKEKARLKSNKKYGFSNTRVRELNKKDHDYLEMS